jgi:signal transduction histidine kinase
VVKMSRGNLAGGGHLRTPQLRRARRLAVALGIAAALLGTTVLIGWMLHITAVTRLHPSFTEMQVPAALAFLLCGALTAGAVLFERAHLARPLLRAGGSAVVILGLWMVRRAAPSGVFFVMIGAALVALDEARDGAPHTAEWLAFAAFWVGGLALTGYLLGVPEISRPGGAFSTALHSSLAMLALAVAIICARPERGLAAIAVSTSSAGTVLRRLVPETLLMPLLGMWILVELLPRLHLFEAKLGMALATTVASTVVAVLEMKLALKLAAIDSDRQAHQTSLRRALADLAQALRDRDRVQTDLERSNRDLDEFAYAASHDLRAPLRGIANLAQWLEEDLGSELPASARQQLELLRSRVHRMEALIDGILKYSRAGRTQESARLVDIDEVLRETIELVAAPPGARIQVAGSMPQLQTERAQLQQVFLNLISNAVKHARRGDPQIEISAVDQNEFVRFTVADNGPGIAPQYHDRIWGMFQTLESRDQVEGTGIGLATVKKLVERRGGRVGVESAEGSGARFFFLWPRHQKA